jgi:general secretion pathway protein G
MIQRLNEKREQDGGFTLIELLVVIVIIGILAGVVVFAVGGIADKGEDSAKESDKRSLQTAEEAFYANTADGTDAVYGTEAQLIGEFIDERSTEHDICVVTSGASYVVVDQGAACAAGSSSDETP